MRMEETLKSGVEQMKVIFELCDHDGDGLIYARDFKEIGLQHFEKPDVSWSMCWVQHTQVSDALL